MTNWTSFLDIPTPSASAKGGMAKDTAEACRERASADLLKSVAMLTANQRLALERSAESWTLRAAMLDRLETELGRSSRASPKAGAEHVRL